MDLGSHPLHDKDAAETPSPCRTGTGEGTASSSRGAPLYRNSEPASPADVFIIDQQSVEKVPTFATEESFMERVWERMESNWERMELGKAGDATKDRSDVRSSNISGQSHSHTPKSSRKRSRRRCQVPFWLAVAVPITSAFLIASSTRFGLENRQQNRLSRTVSDLFAKSKEKHQVLNHELVENNTALHNSGLLHAIHQEVKQFVVEFPDRAVDGLWSHMKTKQKFYQTLTGDLQSHRRELGYAMWAELRDEGRLNHSGSIIVSFETGAVSAVQHDHLKDGRPSYLWYEAGPDHLGNSSGPLKRWSLDEAGNPFSGIEPRSALNLTTTGFYEVQARLAAENPTGQPLQAWSAIHTSESSEEAMVAWTSPVAYCGNYSCFEGVIAASVTLASLKDWCDGAWRGLAALLAESRYDFPVYSNTSSVFVVHQAGRDPEQVGLLIGASGSSFSSRLAELKPAAESTQPIVSNTARAIIKHHGGWNASVLYEEASPFAYRVTPEGGIDTLADSEYDPFCSHCKEVATLSMQLDDKTRWLVVLVLPVGAFTQQLSLTEADVTDKVQKAQHKLTLTFNGIQLTNVIIFLVMILCSVVLGAALTAWVSRDLRGLSRHMRQLSKLDFSTDSEEFRQLLCGRRSAISDVCELQEAFCRLAQSVRTFGRFVPESVVRNIVRGNERHLRLHVSRREVTVMFMNIRDFTSISENLSQTDLLFVLTRYLTVMTQLVEHFSGVVTEILGDGVLAFWNTPEHVEDHATKACACALAQQQALVWLNEELEALQLPRLGMRIGLHTGMVLSGNLGSATKMKFGCMGDTVNLASRLEGLCGHYDVGILCSGETSDAVRGIVCRSLNLVQVKGKNEPTLICEVVGRDGEVQPGEPEQPVAGPMQQARVRRYEAALAAFHRADFVEACMLAQQLLKELPQDKATLKLLHRAWSYIGPDADGCIPVFTDEDRAAWTGVVVMTDK